MGINILERCIYGATPSPAKEKTHVLLYCKHTDSRVVDSRTTDDGAAIRRRRQCTSCARRFTTVETTTISVR